MKTLYRICKTEHTVTDEAGKSFTIEVGKKYLTSEVGVAVAAHGPGPEVGHVIVFSKYWVSVPVEVFHD